MTQTENHKYNDPEKGTANWHILLNENFRSLDSDVPIKDVESNLNSYLPKNNATFIATDTGAVYDADGNSWSKASRSYDSFSITGTRRITLSGNITLDETDAQIQNIEPGGATRTVTLPSESNGVEFIIANRADATEDLVVADDVGATVVTVTPNSVGRVISDGTGWIGFIASGNVT